MGGGLVDKVLDIFGLGDEDIDIYEDEVLDSDDLEKGLITNDTRGKLVSIHKNTNIKVVTMEFVEFEDVISVCDYLKHKKIVLINLKQLNLATAQRCVDFVSGAVSVIDGSVREISTGILLLTPNNVEISTSVDDKISRSSSISWVGMR